MDDSVFATPAELCPANEHLSFNTPSSKREHAYRTPEASKATNSPKYSSSWNKFYRYLPLQRPLKSPKTQPIPSTKENTGSSKTSTIKRLAYATFGGLRGMLSRSQEFAERPSPHKTPRSSMSLRVMKAMVERTDIEGKRLLQVHSYFAYS
jgi:hypothetical protein